MFTASAIGKVSLATFGLIGLLWASAAQAQTPSPQCRGRGFIDSVYQNGLGGTDYEYMVIVRNQTSSTMKLDLSFSGFPQTVTLFSPQLPGISLQAHASQTIRFGRGTNGNINMGTVSVVYDGAAAAGRPSVKMSRCTG